METARAWLEGDGRLPVEVFACLAAHESFGAVQVWRAEPEVKLFFDNLGGEPRNSDLVVHARDSLGAYLIAVEAKADEPFGETVADALAAAIERHLANDRSAGVKRIQQLARALLGPRQKGDPPLKHIRYQLLTACAGALCEAERCGYDRTVLLIHEFVTDKTTNRKLEANKKDLNRFVKRLSHGLTTGLDSGELAGPFFVPGRPLVSDRIALFIGKASRDVRNDRTHQERQG